MHGLNRLTDTGREVTGQDPHYPIRRRGERRRLNPNWAAIAWLEASALTDTEIDEIGDPDNDGLSRMHAVGYGRHNFRTYIRPMIQIIPNEASSAWNKMHWVTPCPDCDDWAYTATCEVHDDNAIRKEPADPPPGSLIRHLEVPPPADLPLRRISPRLRGALSSLEITITFDVQDDVSPILQQLAEGFSED